MHGLHGPAPRERGADDSAPLPLEQLCLERAIFDQKRLFVEGILDDSNDMRPFERLGDKVVRALFHREHSGLHRAVRGHQHNLGLRRHGLGCLEQIHARGLRHHQVGEQHAHAMLAQ